MNKYLLYPLLFLLSCEPSEEASTVKKEANNTITVSESDTTLLEEDMLEETELNFVVSVSQGYNYDSLHTIAVDVAQLLAFKFDTFDRYYDPKRGIILPDNHQDDIWAGQYLFRRSGDEVVSIERNCAYIDTLTAKHEAEADRFYKDTTKMFVFATMYTDPHMADSIKNILKKKYPTAKVIPTEIYVGCMH